MPRQNGRPNLPEQASAVPFRRAGDRIEFCLITTSAGRWGFPKGYIDRGETPEQAALKEALEEAGLHGRILGTPLLSYKLDKNGQTRRVVALLMEVTAADDQWDEADIRQRRWVSQPEARDLLGRESLQACLEIAQSRIPQAREALVG